MSKYKCTRSKMIIGGKLVDFHDLPLHPMDNLNQSQLRSVTPAIEGERCHYCQGTAWEKRTGVLVCKNCGSADK